jgi:hypothetical protein
LRINADASQFGDKDGNKAKGLFWHSSMANHPSDLGMRRLADLILAGFDVPHGAQIVCRCRPRGLTCNAEYGIIVALFHGKMP